MFRTLPALAAVCLIAFGCAQGTSGDADVKRGGDDGGRARDGGRTGFDAGRRDAGGSPTDGGAIDAGSTDGGALDAGTDAGSPGIDGGPPCSSVPEVCNGADDNCNGTADETGCAAGCFGRTRDGHAYMFCTANVEWSPAESTCAAHGMKLVKIDSGSENAFVISSRTSSGDLWIGANDRDTEDRWIWPDGTHFWQGESGGSAQGGAYSNWDPGEPNNDGGEDCAEMQGDGQWNDVPCDIENDFVCEQY